VAHGHGVRLCRLIATVSDTVLRTKLPDAQTLSWMSSEQHLKRLVRPRVIGKPQVEKTFSNQAIIFMGPMP
jgi:hypothetical protein